MLFVEICDRVIEKRERREKTCEFVFWPYGLHPWDEPKELNFPIHFFLIIITMKYIFIIEITHKSQ